MPCYKPIKGYRSRTKTKNGKYSFTTKLKDGYKDLPLEVPCGQCIGCRLARSKDWATRCVHEASLYENNAFITLTFNNQHNKPSLDVKDFQKFMKRLRKKFTGTTIRFFHCGEYGDKTQRAHHHACLFNIDFPDKELWDTRDGIPLYRSKILERLWPYGFSTIGEVTFESAAYVARYITKKINTSEATKIKLQAINPRKYKNIKTSREHYTTVDKSTGEVIVKKPEYTTMSRRPGIGKAWFDKYKNTDVYNKDFITIRNGIKARPPKYYDNLYDIENKEHLDNLKISRKIQANKRKEEPKRLSELEHWQKLKAKKLIRGVEKA